MKKDEVTKIGFYSHSLTVITSVHHIYGAVLYNTAWRLHVLMISVPTLIITEILRRLLIKKEGSFMSGLLGLYWIIVLVFSVGSIGIFEGLYNHVLKDILYFAGVRKDILYTLFPPPVYVMPDDFLFEFTGVLQGFVAIPMMIWFTRLTKSFFRKLEKQL
jgi:hypothetical protein